MKIYMYDYDDSGWGSWERTFSEEHPRSKWFKDVVEMCALPVEEFDRLIAHIAELEVQLMSYQIGATLADEKGMPGLGVAIWPKGTVNQSTLWKGTVGEFLAQADRNIIWCIDGGWGGPPGPIHLKYENGRWHNGGFGGRAWM